MLLPEAAKYFTGEDSALASKILSDNNIFSDATLCLVRILSFPVHNIKGNTFSVWIIPGSLP